MAEQMELEMKRRRVAPAEASDAAPEGDAGGRKRVRVRETQTEPLHIEREAMLGYSEWFDGAAQVPAHKGYWDLRLKQTGEHMRLWFEPATADDEAYWKSPTSGLSWNAANIGNGIEFRGLAQPWPDGYEWLVEGSGENAWVFPGTPQPRTRVRPL